MDVKLVKTYYIARLYLVKVRKCGRFITVFVSSRDYDFNFWILNAHVQFSALVPVIFVANML